MLYNCFKKKHKQNKQVIKFELIIIFTRNKIKEVYRMF